ncbi:HEPN family nuclease [Sphingobacterium sp. ML3W]|uniref:HEPN family nuclease n=1 Tax=Sphingobacterium sp. ML3W TaxID=1538644 RepID=UPI00249A4FFD|nr:HEPN family nuclease [Sphingobacterium sp. ML3W]WFA80377.1 HEPN family nuclease [Sphingobacterium sp. ML3W]
MGNYKNLETEFIERTLHLISQYESQLHKYSFAEQYNHTLLINCLLGVIVLPKERTIGFLPNSRLTRELLENMGIKESIIHDEYQDLRSLVIKLRHCIAHFSLSFESEGDDFLINRIHFKDYDNRTEIVIASFIPEELLNFIRYYGNWVISNIRKNQLE